MATPRSFMFWPLSEKPVVAAVNGLTPPPQPVTITVDLGGGNFTGITAGPPANVTLVFENGTFNGHSPALTVVSAYKPIRPVRFTLDELRTGAPPEPFEPLFTWPGAFGTWWQADPSADLILIYLIQNAPDLSAEAGTAVAGNTSLAKLRTAQPKFVRRTYQALGL